MYSVRRKPWAAATWRMHQGSCSQAITLWFFERLVVDFYTKPNMCTNRCKYSASFASKEGGGLLSTSCAFQSPSLPLVLLPLAFLGEDRLQILRPPVVILCVAGILEGACIVQIRELLRKCLEKHEGKYRRKL